MKVEEEHVDVLQNIESAIIAVYEAEPDLLDLDVLDAIEALIRWYTLEERGEQGRRLKLADRPRRVFDGARGICEWRLGRAAGDLDLVECEGDGPEPLAHSEMLACLKRIRKSIRFWSAEGGRQGYLNYIHRFIGGAAEAALGR